MIFEKEVLTGKENKDSVVMSCHVMSCHVMSCHVGYNALLAVRSLAGSLGFGSLKLKTGYAENYPMFCVG